MITRTTRRSRSLSRRQSQARSNMVASLITGLLSLAMALVCGAAAYNAEMARMSGSFVPGEAYSSALTILFSLTVIAGAGFVGSLVTASCEVTKL